MGMPNITWDDLRVFLAVHRTGSFAAAARALAVNPATVGRRMSALEDGLGTRLFERTTAGPRITTEGRQALGHALAIEARMVELGAALTDRETLAGRVRLSTSELLAPSLVRPLKVLQARHPELAVDLAIGPGATSLASGEAELALRIRQVETAPASGASLARRVARVGMSAWASPAYLEAHPAGVLEHPDQHRVVRYNEDAPFDPGAGYIDAHPFQVALWTNHMPVVAEAVRAGLGIGVLLDAYAQEVGPELVRVSEPLIEVGVWLAMRREMRDVARVRAVADALADPSMFVRQPD